MSAGTRASSGWQAAFLLALLAITSPLAAQTAATLDIREFAPLLAQLPAADDILVTSSGQLIVARPDVQSVGIVDPTSALLYSPLPGLAPVASGALAELPDGSIAIGDGAAGVVLRYDPASSSATTLVGGFSTPIDVEVGPQNTVFVCDLQSNDFFNGPCDIVAVDLSGPVPVQTTVVAGLTGAADVAWDGLGGVYFAALGSPLVEHLDLNSGARTTVASPVLGPTDLVLADSATLYVTTLLGARFAKIDVASGLVLDVVTGIGGALNGAEDIALTPGGDALVSLNSGAIHEIVLSAPLVQIGNADVGSVCFLTLSLPQSAGLPYSILLSDAATTGLHVGNQIIPIDLTPILIQTTFVRPPELLGFDGTLDGMGSANAGIMIPAIPGLAGLGFYVAGIAFIAPGVLPLADISNGFHVVISP